MITVIASGFDNSINASSNHRASTSILSRNNPQLVNEPRQAAPVTTTSRSSYARPEPAPAPAPRQQAAPGFLFGDDSVNSRVQAAREPEAAPAPAPEQAPAQPVQPIPVQRSYSAPAPAPEAAPAPGQYGGKPQVNVTPAAPAPAQSKTAKPWFMFGNKENDQ